MTRNFVACCCVAVLTAGCASEPMTTALPAQPASSSTFHIVERLPTENEKLPGTSIDNTSFSAEGAIGSLAVGVLLGPIGAVGNVLYVQSENRRRAGAVPLLTGQNLAAILTKTLPNNFSSGLSQYQFVPAAILHFSDDTTYSLTCLLNVELAQSDAQKPWKARYSVENPVRYDTSKPDDTQKAIDSLEACFIESYTLFSGHMAGKFVPFSPMLATIKTPPLGSSELRFLISDSALPTRIITDSGTGLVEQDPTMFTNIHKPAE